MANQNVSLELQENLAQIFPGLSLEEAIQHQETPYQSLQPRGKQTVISSSNEPSSSQGHSTGEALLPGSGDYDLALDEAMAISLQEFEYDPRHFSISEAVQNTASSSRHVAGGTPVAAANENEVNPDVMSYEELQSLGDRIGRESKGLSENDTSCLATHIHKVGWFSMKVQTEDCVVCCAGYKDEQSVTILPCAHKYHTECVNMWLKKTSEVSIDKWMEVREVSEFLYRVVGTGITVVVVDGHL